MAARHASAARTGCITTMRWLLAGTREDDGARPGYCSLPGQGGKESDGGKISALPLMKKLADIWTELNDTLVDDHDKLHSYAKLGKPSAKDVYDKLRPPKPKKAW
ncbi:hypothetical protein Dimus_008551 [Dionaea muscipula]